MSKVNMRYVTLILIMLILTDIGCSFSQEKQKSKTISEFKMSNKMDEDEFWKIIDYAFEVAGEDQEREQQIIVQKLSAYTDKQIVDFELIFGKKLIAANDFKILAAARIIEDSVTDDGWLYFKCWLISRGKSTFNNTLKNPDYLASEVKKGIVADFESMLYVSTKAYKNRTGKNVEDDSFPRDIAFKMGINYESDGPSITGKNWKEEDLPKLYPKLWSKFN